MPFMAVYLSELGFSDSEIGLVHAMQGFAVIVGPPLVTAIADKWLSIRLLIAVMYVVMAITLWLILQSTTLAAQVVVFSIYCVGISATLPLMDSLSMQSISRGIITQTFQGIRLWGSIGFAIAGVVLFVWFQAFGGTARTAIIIGGVVIAITTLAGYWLPNLQRTSERATQSRFPTLDAIKTLCRRDTLTVEVSIFFVSVAGAIYSTLYSLYVVRVGLGLNWIGLVTSIGVVVEIFCMLVLARWIDRFGIRGIMLVGVSSMILRMAALAMFAQPVTAIVTQLLHGPLIIAMYILPVMYLHSKAGESHQASTLGVHTMLCGGIARLLGSAIGGSISESYAVGDDKLPGIQVAFWVGSILCVIATAMVFIGLRRDDTFGSASTS